MSPTRKRPTVGQDNAQPPTQDDVQNVAIVGLAQEVTQLRNAVEGEIGKMWTALGGIAGLDGLAVGMANVAEVLGPLRQLVPTVVHANLNPGVPASIRRTLTALGLWAVDENGEVIVGPNGLPLPGGLQSFDRLPDREWGGPARRIGEVDATIEEEEVKR